MKIVHAKVEAKNQQASTILNVVILVVKANQMKQKLLCMWHQVNTAILEQKICDVDDDYLFR